MCNVVFMNFRQLVESMLYRINNDIGWREIVFCAVDVVSGSVHSWTLSEIADTVAARRGSMREFLKCHGLVELGFIFVR